MASIKIFTSPSEEKEVKMIAEIQLVSAPDCGLKQHVQWD